MICQFPKIPNHYGYEARTNRGWHIVISSYLTNKNTHLRLYSIGHWWINYSMGPYATFNEDVISEYLIKKTIHNMLFKEKSPGTCKPWS